MTSASSTPSAGAEGPPPEPQLRLSDQPTEPPPDEDVEPTRDGERPRAGWRRALVSAELLGRDVEAHIGRYRVLHKLGQGGMGTVVAAYDDTLERRVALKLLHDDLSVQRRQRVRLLREAQAMARLSHPNVVTVYEADVWEDQLFIAMELVDGITLDKWQRQRPRSWRECVAVYAQAGRGLQAAHAEQLIHRDFKPGNCIVDANDRVRVLDFGLARDSSSGPVPAEAVAVSQPSALNSNITNPGAIMGTVAYMSPEQLRGQPADARSDQFSFCVSLHEALFGHRPFLGDTAGELFATMVAGREAKIGRRARVPMSVQRVLQRGLRIERDERFESMAELLDALEQIPRRRRWIAIATGVGLSAALGAGAVWVASPNAGPSPCAALQERPVAGWDDQARQQVQQAILGTDLADAPTVWKGVSAGLDTYAQRWTTIRLGVCESSRIEGSAAPAVHAAQRSCLDKRARVLSALTSRLAQGDRLVVARAVAATESLPALDECEPSQVQVDDDEDALTAPLRRQRDALADRTARVFVLERLSRFDEAIAAAEAVVVDARAFAEHHPLPLLEALLVQGRLLRRSRHHRAAAEALTEALPIAERTHHEHRVLDVALERVMLSLGQGQPAVAEAWLQQAKAKLQRLGPTPRRERRTLHIEGRLARASGELDRAAELLLAARERCAEEPEPDACHAAVLTTLAVVREDQQAFEEAESLYLEALAGHRSRGDLHKVAETLHNLAGLFVGRGRVPEAVQYYREALELLSSFHEPGAPVVASARFGLAHALRSQGEVAEALEHAGLAARSFDKAGATEDRFWALQLIAELLTRQGKISEALARYSAAEALLSELETIDPSSRIVVLQGIGDCLRILGRYDEAEPRVLRALELAEAEFGEQHIVRVYTLLNLGNLRLAQGQPGAAREAFEQAWQLQQHHDQPALRAGVTDRLARSLWATGEVQRARSLWGTAKDIYVELGADDEIANMEAFRSECADQCP